jgi:hypothetical protein
MGSSFVSDKGIDAISLSIFDLYHDVAKDFGINLVENLTVKEADINFNDEIDENMVLIQEPESFDQEGIPIIPIKNDKYVKIAIDSPEKFAQIMSREYILRKRVKAMDDARGTIRSKCHVLYVIEFKHRMSLQPTYLFFLRLFASDKEGQLRIHTLQFASLTHFLHDLARQEHPIPKIDTALTNLLAGPLTCKSLRC